MGIIDKIFGKKVPVNKLPKDVAKLVAKSAKKRKNLGKMHVGGNRKINIDKIKRLNEISRSRFKNRLGKGKTRWQYITEWHNKRASELFGNLAGRKFPGRTYDVRYKGKDIEYKSDNFSKGTRSQGEISRMEKQIDKDIALYKQGKANPHWHFEHDPRNSPEMKPLLDKLDKAGIPWTHGSETPF